MGVVHTKNASATLHAAWRRAAERCNPASTAGAVHGSSKAPRRGCEAAAFTSITRDAGKTHARRGAGDDDRGEAHR